MIYQIENYCFYFRRRASLAENLVVIVPWVIICPYWRELVFFMSDTVFMQVSLQSYMVGVWVYSLTSKLCGMLIFNFTIFPKLSYIMWQLFVQAIPGITLQRIAI